MLLLRFLILIVVIISEKNKILVFMSQLLVFICVFFFFSSNLISLFVFFEISMFPIILIILGYGSQIEKINSSYYLIFYASFCSFPFLFVLFYYKIDFHFVYFLKYISWELVFLITLCFIIKFPVYFLHLWLPKAHVEAPTTASILLAGLLLKLGTVGFFRILKLISFIHLNFWFFLSFLGIILSSFTCAFQRDSKSLAAYSSVSHIGFTLLCLVLLRLETKVSGLIIIVAHGFTSTLIFYFIGEFYHGRNTRMIYYLNRFLNISLFIVLLFTLTFISNAGVPPSIRFFAEFISISVFLNYIQGSFFILFLYFFFAFYYRIYFITNFFIGKSNIFFNSWRGSFSLFHLFLIFNFFWLSIFL
jgi:NADH-ubiquinone oxidoreductase chain 4